MKKIGSILIILLLVLNAYSKTSVTLQANKKIVKLGDPILVRVNVNGNENIKSVETPSNKDIDIIRLGTSSNVSIINGVVSNSYSYNFQIYPKKKGTITIPPFKVTTSSGSYKSKNISIEVLSNLSSNTSTTGIDHENVDPSIFFKIVPTKKSVFPNESICLKYILYTKIQFTSPQLVKEPDFKDVISDDFEQTGQKKPVNISGKQYWEIELGHRVITPLKTGEIVLSPAKLKVMVLSKRNNRDVFGNFNSIFDDFDKFFDDDFFSSPFTRTVPRLLTSSQVKISVKPLPKNAPKEYSDIIGDFKISSKLDRSSVKAGDAINLTVSLSGKGNLGGYKLNPVLGKDLQIFDSHSKLEKSVVNNGLYSKLEDNIVIMPQKSGRLTIPSIKVCFFDPEKSSYKTISTKPIEIDVKGDFKKQELLSSAPSLSINEKKDISVLENNISYIIENIDDRPFIPLNKKKWPKIYIIFLVLLPLIVLFFRTINEKYLSNDLWLNKKTSYSKADKKLLKIVNDMNGKVSSKEYREILEIIQEYFGNAYGLPIISGSTEFEKSLTRALIPEKIKAHLLIIYSQIYQGAYSPQNIKKETFLELIEDVRNILKQCHKFKNTGASK